MWLEKPSEVPENLECSRARYNDDEDDVRSVLADLCGALAETEGVRFAVRGFGQDVWPVDVRTDLCTVLEQLPDCLHKLALGRECALDFYEQGIERTLRFLPRGEDVEIVCESHLQNWRPSPNSFREPVGQILSMLRRLSEDFLYLAEKVGPKLVVHPWVLEWKRRREGSGSASGLRQA